eukprot:gnl/TRDRNA2_/TRDRNA2_167555_c1_seq2.p1 gnl/TRDRNA2_/TRDRNA2_167555_c1~~gnl/TRDRNA2_/TRDRNA2_167555_c1_seq2.p1  ORF type:complete len:302 (+),score=49.32 gnl/TRDRNA2_/TRDRNA2_167555_c1_seq2:101-907(+)
MLTVILQAFTKAVSVVLWVGVLTVLIDYVLAIVVTQVIGHHAHWWGEDEHLVRDWFGTIPHSMETLFQFMTLSLWNEVAETLSKELPEGVVWPCFIAYLLICSYSMMSLITGVISDALISARADEESLKLAQLAENREAHLKDLKDLFGTMDSDSSGSLTCEEVKVAVESHPEILLKLEALDISIDKAQLVQLIEKLGSAEDDATISIDMFIEALESLKGDAKASRVFDLKFALSCLEKKVDNFDGKLDGLCNDMREVLEFVRGQKGR